MTRATPGPSSPVALTCDEHAVDEHGPKCSKLHPYALHACLLYAVGPLLGHVFCLYWVLADVVKTIFNIDDRTLINLSKQ